MTLYRCLIRGRWCLEGNNLDWWKIVEINNLQWTISCCLFYLTSFRGRFRQLEASKITPFAITCNSFCLLIFAANSSIFNETELLDLPLAFETNTFLKLANLSSFRQSLKMAKHNQTIRRQIGDELFECVWPFCNISAYRVKMSLKFHCF